MSMGPSQVFVVVFRGSLVFLLRTPRATWRCCSFWPTMRTGAAEQKEDDLTGLASPSTNAGYWITHKSSINKHKGVMKFYYYHHFFLRGPGCFDVFFVYSRSWEDCQEEWPVILEERWSDWDVAEVISTWNISLGWFGRKCLKWLVRWSCPKLDTVWSACIFYCRCGYIIYFRCWYVITIW